MVVSLFYHITKRFGKGRFYIIMLYIYIILNRIDVDIPLRFWKKEHLVLSMNVSAVDTLSRLTKLVRYV